MPCLALLPGMDGTGELFEPFVDALGRRSDVQVLRYPPGVAGYAELERFVRERLPHDRPYVLLGESYSGPIALSIAASRPQRLVGLVLCCTFGRCPVHGGAALRQLASLLPLGSAPQWALDAALLGRFSTPALRERLRFALAQLPPSTLRARLRDVLAVDISSRVRDVAVPALCLQATRDRLVRAAASKHLNSLLSSVRVVSLEAPHFLLQARPGEAAAAVGAFLREVAPNGDASPS